MTQAIILAGGYSSRAGLNKMGLLYSGKPLIHHTIDSLKAEVSKIFVVTGHYHDELVSILSSYPDIFIVHNEQYPLGMFSSVLCGVKAVTEDFFIIPGDYPVVKPSTFHSMNLDHADLLVPRYLGKSGHPLFLNIKYKEMLLNQPIESNLKVFRDQHPVSFIDVDDEGILLDIDTISDYESLKKSRKE